MPKILRFGTNPRVSDVVVHGGTVYLRGFVPVATRNGSIADQVTEVLEQLDRALETVGSNRSRLVQVSLWLSDIGNLGALNEVWDQWCSPGQAPARACVESRLFAPDVFVEASAIAATNEDM